MSEWPEQPRLINALRKLADEAEVDESHKQQLLSRIVRAEPVNRGHSDRLLDLWRTVTRLLGGRNLVMSSLIIATVLIVAVGGWLIADDLRRPVTQVEAGQDDVIGSTSEPPAESSDEAPPLLERAALCRNHGSGERSSSSRWRPVVMTEFPCVSEQSTGSWSAWPAPTLWCSAMSQRGSRADLSTCSRCHRSSLRWTFPELTMNSWRWTRSTTSKTRRVCLRSMSLSRCRRCPSGRSSPAVRRDPVSDGGRGRTPRPSGPSDPLQRDDPDPCRR